MPFLTSYGNQEETHAYTSGQWASLTCIINAENLERYREGGALWIQQYIKSYLEFRGNNAEGITGGIGTISFWTRHWNERR